MGPVGRASGRPPNSNALAALLLLDGSLAAPLHPMSAPFSMYCSTLCNRSGSEQPSASAHHLFFFFMRDGFPGHVKLVGNSAQNSFPAGFLYPSLTGIFGNFGLNCFSATGGVGPAAAASSTRNSHSLLVLAASGHTPVTEA